MAPFVAWAAYALNMWLGGQALMTRVLAGVLLPLTCLLVAMVIRENLPAESLVQRQIWGDRARAGYLKSRQAKGVKKESSSDLLEKCADKKTLRNSHVDGTTEDQTLCTLPGAPSIPTHTATIFQSEEHVISVEPSEDSPSRPSRSNMSGVGTVHELEGQQRDCHHPIVYNDSKYHSDPNQDVGQGQTSDKKLCLHPRRMGRYIFPYSCCCASIISQALLDSSMPDFHPCPVAFSKRRLIYWGFGFGLLVLMMLVLVGVVEPMLKKRFPGNRWVNGTFRGMMAAWVVLWTGWLSWQALFTFWPGLLKSKQNKQQ